MSEQCKIAFEKWFEKQYGAKPQPNPKKGDAPHSSIYMTMFADGAYRGYIAATAEANRRIDALEKQIIEMTAYEASMQRISCEDTMKISQLQANNNDLREALELLITTKGYKYKFGKTSEYESMRDKAWDLADKALSASPAESLQAHDDELLERAAKLCDRFIKQEHSDGNSATAIMLIKDEIRALKGQ